MADVKKIATRESYGNALKEYAEEYPNLVVLDADLAAATKTAIFYISPKQALAAKIVEDSVQILNEKYATQHAIGVVEWAEVDCKIQNQQAVAVLKMAAS